MGAITPVAAGTAGYVDKVRGMYTGAQTGGQALLSVGSIDNNRTRFRQLMFYFATIADGDTWASGIAGIKGAFWHGDTDNADPCNVSTTDLVGNIVFETGGATSNGWVLLFIDSEMGAASGQGFSIR